LKEKKKSDILGLGGTNMNIFFTDQCPIKCAKNLDTKRVNKMILESCQMLATAVNENGGSAIYKSTHKKHPSTLWVTESYSNWKWLWNHMVALALEYKKRRGKVHASFKKLTDKPNCAARQDMGISYKHLDDVYTAYKLYLADRWETDKREPVWI
jgi:hypothetical protein